MTVSEGRPERACRRPPCRRSAPALLGLPTWYTPPPPQAPGFGERRKALLQDIAIVTGAEFVAKDLGMKASTGAAESSPFGRPSPPSRLCCAMLLHPCRRCWARLDAPSACAPHPAACLPFSLGPALATLQVEQTTLEQLGTARKVTVANTTTTMIADQVRLPRPACPAPPRPCRLAGGDTASGYALRLRRFATGGVRLRQRMRTLCGRRHAHGTTVGRDELLTAVPNMHPQRASSFSCAAGQQGRDQGTHRADQEGALRDRLWWVGRAGRRLSAMRSWHGGRQTTRAEQPGKGQLAGAATLLPPGVLLNTACF